MAKLGMMLIGLGLQAGPLRVGCLGGATAKGAQTGQSGAGTNWQKDWQWGKAKSEQYNTWAFPLCSSRRLKDARPPPLSMSVMELLTPLAKLPVRQNGGRPPSDATPAAACPSRRKDADVALAKAFKAQAGILRSERCRENAKSIKPCSPPATLAPAAALARRVGAGAGRAESCKSR